MATGQDGNHTVLKNISFRVVGPFLRVNSPFSAVATPSVGPAATGAPFAFDFPTLSVAQPATVKSVMDAVRLQVGTLGYQFDYSNLNGTGKTELLDRVSFGKTGGTVLTLDATKISLALKGQGSAKGSELVAAWQYYIFKKGDFNEDERVEVSGRAPYTRSLLIRDNMRIVWRLLIVYRGSSQVMALV